MNHYHIRLLRSHLWFVNNLPDVQNFFGWSQSFTPVCVCWCCSKSCLPLLYDSHTWTISCFWWLVKLLELSNAFGRIGKDLHRCLPTTLLMQKFIIILEGFISTILQHTPALVLATKQQKQLNPWKNLQELKFIVQISISCCYMWGNIKVLIHSSKWKWKCRRNARNLEKKEARSHHIVISE